MVRFRALRHLSIAWQSQAEDQSEVVYKVACPRVLRERAKWKPLYVRLSPTSVWLVEVRCCLHFYWLLCWEFVSTKQYYYFNAFFSLQFFFGQYLTHGRWGKIKVTFSAFNPSLPWLVIPIGEQVRQSPTNIYWCSLLEIGHTVCHNIFSVRNTNAVRSVLFSDDSQVDFGYEF